MNERALITLDQLMTWEPWYSRDQILEITGGRESLTPLEVLDLDIPLSNRFWVLLREEVLCKERLGYLSADYAEHVLPIYERAHPDDPRPRNAIEAARAYARGELSRAELDATRTAAWGAAWEAWTARASGAAERAAGAAERVARAAAWAAEWDSAVAEWASGAAREAARVAARAAWDAAWEAARAAWDAAWEAWTARASGAAERDAERAACAERAAQDEEAWQEAQLRQYLTKEPEPPVCSICRRPHGHEVKHKEEAWPSH